MRSPRLVESNFRQQVIDWLAWGYFALLIGLSLWFFKERITYYDSSSYLYKIIEGDTFKIAHGRYSAFLTQLLPLLCIKLGLSLKWVTMAYSLNFPLVYFFGFLFIRYVTQHRDLVVAYLLFNVFSCTHLFFWPVSEMFQGIHYVLILYAWIASPIARGALTKLMGTFCFSMLVFLAHPIMLIVVAFVFIIEGWEYVRGIDTQWIYPVILTLVVFLGLKLLIQEGGYDKKRTSVIFSFIDLLPQITHLKSLKVFSIYLQTDHLDLIVLIGGNLVFLILTQKWRQGILYVAGMIGYTILLLMAYQNGESRLVFENLLRPIVLFSVFTLAMYVLPAVRKFKIHGLIVIMILVFSLEKSISFGETIISRRTTWYQDLMYNLNDLEAQKLVMHSKHQDKKIMSGSWAASTELILLSTLQNPQKTMAIQVTSKVEKIMGVPEKRQRLRFPYTHFYLTRPLKPTLKALFSFSDGLFFNVNAKPEIGTLEAQSTFTPENLRITLKAENITGKVESKAYYHIEIENNSGTRVPSNLDWECPFSINQVWWKGKKKVFGGRKNIPLMVDAGATYRQLLAFKLLKKPGKDYFLQVELIAKECGIRITSEKIPVRIER